MSGSRGVISAQVRAPPSRVPRRRALQTSCLVRRLALVPAASRRPATPKHRTLLARSPSHAADVVSCAQPSTRPRLESEACHAVAPHAPGTKAACPRWYRLQRPPTRRAHFDARPVHVSLLAGFPVDAGERPPRGCARRSLAGETISSPAACHRCHAQPPAPAAPAPRAPPSRTPRPPNSPDFPMHAPRASHTPLLFPLLPSLSYNLPTPRVH